MHGLVACLFGSSTRPYASGSCPPPRLSTAETPPLELRRQTPCSPVRVRLVFNGPSQFGTGLCALAATPAALCEACRNSTGGSRLLWGQESWGVQLHDVSPVGGRPARPENCPREKPPMGSVPSAQCPSRLAIQRHESSSRRLTPSLMSPFPIRLAPRLSDSGALTPAHPLRS